MRSDRTEVSEWGRRVAAMAAAWGLWGPSAAWAQGDPAEETSLPGGQLVVLAYAILWVGLIGYVVYLGRRQSDLTDEIDELEGRIDEALGESAADD